MTNIYLILSILLITITGLNAQENIETTCNNVFEYKEVIAPVNSFKKLLNNPTIIESYVNPERKDGVKTLDTLFDTHAVFEIPISKLINMVLDLENEQNIFPRMIHTKDLNPSDPLWSPHLQKVNTHFRMGRIVQDYHYIFYKIPELRKDGSFLIKWNLHESIDGKFDFIFGSWFMKEINFDGKKYTYVRNYAHYGMSDYPTYVLLGMKIGGKKDSKGFFEALLAAAE